MPDVRERAQQHTELATPSLRGVVVVDAGGLVRHADAEAAALLGSSTEELVGGRLGFELQPGTHTLEVRTTHGPRVAEVSVSTVEYAGEHCSVLALADLTGALDEARRRAETTLLLESALGAASHEIRSPIAVILVGTETLRLRWDDLSEEDRLDTVRRIERQARFLRRVGDRILGGTGHDELALVAEPQTIDVESHLFTKLADFGASPDQVKVSCPPGTRAHADPDQVWEILVNFIENSMKYAHPPVDVEVLPHRSWVEFRVCDEGPGVDPEFVDDLFRPFRRSPDTADRAIGTGLGLSLSRELARANGGDAWYEPNEPTGACFCFSVPRAF